jgi:hypothetical protein
MLDIYFKTDISLDPGNLAMPWDDHHLLLLGLVRGHRPAAAILDTRNGVTTNLDLPPETACSTHRIRQCAYLCSSRGEGLPRRIEVPVLLQ